jgi:hypothetical protein
MAHDMWVNISGVWKKITKAWVNISGTWKVITDGWVNIGGTWKKIWTYATWTGTLDPDADDETTGWVATPLWSKLTQDASNIQTTPVVTWPNSVDFDFEVTLEDPASTPVNNTCLVHVDCKMTNSGA